MLGPALAAVGAIDVESDPLPGRTALKGAKLVEALATYRPGQELDFTIEELKELHIFRGAASHAESRRGIAELKRVQEQVSEREASQLS